MVARTFFYRVACLMLRLPPLVCDDRPLQLPMADRSAVVLGELLLSKNAAIPPAVLAETLAADPTLLLWTAWAANRKRVIPHGIDDLAAWLAERLPDVLDWPAAGEPRPYDRENPAAETLGPSVVQALAMDGLTVELAGAAGDADVTAARLRALLSQAGAMLSAVDPQVNDTAAGTLPSWMTDPQTDPPEVAQARAILDDAAPIPEGIDSNLDACRERAEKGRRRWQAADRRAEWLPAIAAQSRRLRALETRFRETVEAEKLEAMAEFAAGAGHEINNPLTVISGRAQLFLRDEADPEKRRALALISAQAMRVYEMISDLMLFARPPHPEPQSIDAVELIHQVIEEMAAEAEQQEIVLRHIGREEPVSLEADPTQLTVALKAMCRNAVEAIGREGVIELSVDGDGREVRLHVSDDGPGIPPEERRHIFDPYYSARQAGRGLGMGLSKAWRIITNHGGRIEVESEPGEGAAFTIVLPQP